MNRRTFLCTLAASGGLGMLSIDGTRSIAAMTPEPRFRVRAEIRNGQLLIHYEVENPSARDLYLYTREVVANDRIDEVPGIEFDRDHRTLFVYKLPNVAEGTNVAQPIRGLVTPVRAGQRFEDTVNVALPAREFLHGVARMEGCQEISTMYRGLRFAIHYVLSIPDAEERMEKIGDIKVLQPIFPLARQLDGGWLRYTTIPLDIPVVECVLN